MSNLNNIELILFNSNKNNDTKVNTDEFKQKREKNDKNNKKVSFFEKSQSSKIINYKEFCLNRKKNNSIKEEEEDEFNELNSVSLPLLNYRLSSNINNDNNDLLKYIFKQRGLIFNEITTNSQVVNSNNYKHLVSASLNFLPTVNNKEFNNNKHSNKKSAKLKWKSSMNTLVSKKTKTTFIYSTFYKIKNLNCIQIQFM
jgi:hypothetical protein